MLETAFADADGAFRPVPWWAWTGGLEPELRRAQLRLMHEQGLREFFVFPIYGIEVEYLSEAYFAAIEAVLADCRALGMRAWIYDEHNWPSGTAGGRVPRHHPEAVAWVVEVETQRAVSAEEARRAADDPAVLHACWLSAAGPVAAKHGAPPAQGGAALVCYRLRRDTSQGLPVRGSLWCRGERGALDMLSPEACRSFLQEAYQPIADRFLPQYADVLVGFFTDEPALASGGGALPWTEAMPEQFREAYGYDLLPCLPDLTFDTPTAARTRTDFWSLVTRLSAEAFAGQLADWCEEHGLLLTGHMLAEESAASVRAHGDTPAHLRRMHVPGCDLLEMHTSYDPDAARRIYSRLSILKTPKVAASAARAAGRGRVMCEAFGIAPWSRTLADEKRMSDWLGALGVNLLNDNSLIADISGFRKRAIAGKHFTQPWWEHAHLLYEYAGRSCALSAATTLDTAVAVLYPTTSWWALTRVGGERHPELTAAEQALDMTLEALVRRHWSFEFLFEDALAGAAVHDGVLETSQGTFRVVILAGITHLPAAAAARLEQLAAGGGHVVVVGAPALVLGGEAQRPLAAAVEHLGGPASSDLPARLDEMLRGFAGRAWHVTGEGAEGVVSAARVEEAGHSLLFLANQTPGTKELEVRWDGPWAVEIWEAAEGRRFRPEQAAGRLRLTLPEGESVWVVQAGEAQPEDRPPIWWHAEEETALRLDGPWRFRAEPANLFRLPCRLLPDPGGTLSPEEATAASTWSETEWGEAALALEPEGMRAYWLSAAFALDEPVEDLQLIVDSSDTTAALLNGRPLGEAAACPVWNHTNRAWPLHEAGRVGENHLLVRVLASPYYAHPIAAHPIVPRYAEPIVLRGSFGVRAHARWEARLGPMPEELVAGDWREQGFPHFAGLGRYEQRFSWPHAEGPARFVCDAGQDAVEVLLDGVSLGVRAWGPREFLTDRLARGEHDLEVRVWNTLGAVLRRGYLGLSEAPPAGLLSPVRIVTVR
jgi:hypothetical protein